MLIQNHRMPIVLFHCTSHTTHHLHQRSGTKRGKKAHTNTFKTEMIISIKNIWKWSINQMACLMVKTVGTVVSVLTISFISYSNFYSAFDRFIERIYRTVMYVSKSMWWKDERKMMSAAAVAVAAVNVYTNHSIVMEFFEK